MATPYKTAREQQRGIIKNHARHATTAITEMRQRALDTGLLPGVGAIGGAQTAMFGNAGAEKARAYRQFKHWVYVAVNAIATRLAGQPITAAEALNAPDNPERRIHALNTKGGSTQAKQAMLKQHTAAMQFHGLKGYAQDIDLLPNHPALDLLARPNELQQQEEFIYLSAVNLLITGVTYWIGGINDKRPQGAEIWCVPSHWVTPLHKGGLFSAYAFAPPGTTEPTILDPENVQRIYFPDPMDLKNVMSPLMAIMEAVSIDGYIQSSQQNMFERGIDPNVIITVGRKRGPDGNFLDSRPTLGGAARRQMTNAVRDLWNGTVGQGEPAIIDGMIDSIHKLSNTPREMDWTGSGEAVKKRIMQTYRVNPISVGEVTAGNRAQALEADKNFCTNAVNPIGHKFSNSLTDFVGSWYDKPARLLLWIEDCIPTDEGEENKLWVDALRLDAITKTEFRQDRLGLPPDERPERPALMNTVGGISGTVNVLTQVGAGMITPAAAQSLFMLFFDLSEEDAAALVGVGDNYGAPAALPTPPQEPQDNDSGDGDTPDEAIDDDQEESPVDGGASSNSSSNRGKSSRTNQPKRIEHVKPRGGYTEADVKAALARNAGKAESEVAAAMADFFREAGEGAREATEPATSVGER